MCPALAHLQDACAMPHDEIEECRAWKLFALCSRMLLHRPGRTGKAGKQVLSERFDRFERGDWLQLIAEARHSGVGGPPPAVEDPVQHRLGAACRSVRIGEPSKARQQLVGGSLAAGTATTLAELQDPARRPPTQTVPLSDAVREFVPTEPLHLDRQLLFDNLRSAPRGSSGGLSGTRYEHLKVLLDDEESMVLYGDAAERYARANIPEAISRALALGAATALLKPNGRVRGIVTGDAIRRHVARTLAQMYGADIMEACAPYQYALSTRSGMDCVVHALRAATDLDPTLTLISIDGVGAFDHIRRQSMLSKLLTLPRASAMLPFVRLAYGQPSVYLWRDDAGVEHDIVQGEGGEQGDPLMPPCTPLGSTTPCRRWRLNSARAKPCSRTWTTSMPYANRPELLRSSTWSLRR